MNIFYCPVTMLNKVINNSLLIIMALVMLYKTKVRPESVERLSEIRSKFMDLYAEHGITVIGHWAKIDKPHVSYYMTQYSDEAEYHTKIRNLHNDSRYKALTDQLREIRVKSKVKRLVTT